MRRRPFCENNRKSDFSEKEIILSAIFTTRTSPHMKIGSLGKIYQNSPMPLPKIAFFDYFDKKRTNLRLYENSILRHNLWKAFGKNSDFPLFWWKGAPHTWNLDVWRHFVKNFEKVRCFIILKHLFPTEIAKIHLFGILTQNIKKILVKTNHDLDYPPNQNPKNMC